MTCMPTHNPNFQYFPSKACMYAKPHVFGVLFAWRDACQRSHQYTSRAFRPTNPPTHFNLPSTQPSRPPTHPILLYSWSSMVNLTLPLNWRFHPLDLQQNFSFIQPFRSSGFYAQSILPSFQPTDLSFQPTFLGDPAFPFTRPCLSSNFVYPTSPSTRSIIPSIRSFPLTDQSNYKIIISFNRPLCLPDHLVYPTMPSTQPFRPSDYFVYQTIPPVRPSRAPNHFVNRMIPSTRQFRVHDCSLYLIMSSTQPFRLLNHLV